MFNKFSLAPWLVVLGSLLWAFDAPFRKFLTTQLTSTSIIFMEHILLVVLVIPLLLPRFRELKKLKWKEWLAVIFIGAGGSALASVFFTQSFHYINPSITLLLQKLQPILAILLAVVILKETLSKKFWIWALVALFGAYMVTFPDLAISGFSFEGRVLGVVLALSAALLWGGSTVFGRLVLKKVSNQVATSLRFIVALIFLFFVQIYYGRLPETTSASAMDWLFIFIIAVLAGYFAFLLYYRGLQNTKASIATLGETIYIPAAVVVNWIFIPGAALEIGQIAGAAILLFAVYKLSLLNAKEAKEEIKETPYPEVVGTA